MSAVLKPSHTEAVKSRVSKEEWDGLDIIVHSVAFANFSEGLKPFHETRREDFLSRAYAACTRFDEWVRRYRDTRGTAAGPIGSHLTATRPPGGPTPDTGHGDLRHPHAGAV